MEHNDDYLLALLAHLCLRPQRLPFNRPAITQTAAPPNLRAPNAIIRKRKHNIKKATRQVSGLI